MNFSRWGLVCFIALAGNLPAHAQDSYPNFLGAPAPDTPQVTEIGDNDLPTLSLQGQGAISLRASLGGLQANPNADAALKNWVARGNVVFLHTDAAQSFGFATVRLRPTTVAQGGQELIRTRAALPFGAHPLLRGDSTPDTNNRNSPSADVMRLPGIRRVFGSLRAGDVFVSASSVATPLLQLEDITGNGNTPPLYAAAITSLGAGWAIFCPDNVDVERGDGAAFARALLAFIPGQAGQRWVGIPTRSLQGGTLRTLANAVGARLQVANATDGTAALPAFGVNTPPAVAPPTSEPTLPVDRNEAASLLAVVEAGGVRATARVALMQARLAFQNGDPSACTAALNIAAADPALASQIDFWSALLTAQLGGDVNLPSPQRAEYFDQAARTLANSVSLPANASAGDGTTGTPQQNGVPFPVPVSTVRAWSQKLARLSSISALSPPLVRNLIVGDTSASIRFYPGDNNAAALDASVQGLLTDTQLGWRAPHVEILLTPSASNFAALRRVLGRVDANFAPDGDQMGDTILLASGNAVGGGANDATLKRLWSRVLLTTWNDAVRPLPSWLVVGFQSIALGGITGAEQAALQNAARAGALLPLNDSPESLPFTTPLQRAEASSFLAWFYANYGAGGVSNLVARLASGLPVDDSVAAVAGESSQTVDEEWRRSLGA